MRPAIIAAIVAMNVGTPIVRTAEPNAPAPPDPVKELAKEVRDKGWLLFAGKTNRGDWDLFACRPDGSDLKNITNTPNISEFAPQWSRDVTQLMYRRMQAGIRLENNAHGMQGELVIADADGKNPQAFGRLGEYTWASWGPDGKQFVCLTRQGILFVEIASKKVVRTLPRKGFYQQMTWSPDGKWLSGVSNGFGTAWAVARMNVETGAVNAISRVDCCTPDWTPDNKQVVFACRNVDKIWTQLWIGDPDGKNLRMLYGEQGRHIYGGHVSPDGKYVLFTGNSQENGDPGHNGAPMALMRIADAPMVGGESRWVRRMNPGAKSSPVLQLPTGWEPIWTDKDLFTEAATKPAETKPATTRAGK